MKNDVYTATVGITPETLARAIAGELGGCMVPLHAYQPDLAEGAGGGQINIPVHNQLRAKERERLEERAERILARLCFKPPEIPECEGANDCGWKGIVLVVPKDAEDDSAGWRACREHAAPFRKMTDRFRVIDVGRNNGRVRPRDDASSGM